MGERGFDYVVIGAGSSGCVVAARLARAGARVLLLEAGPVDRRREIHIPAASGALAGSELDWNYLTEPQAALEGRRLYWPRGKVLGGSSSINRMVYVRGNPADYDAWAEAGCAGWGYTDVLPLFLRSEDNARAPSPFHARGGPWHVSDVTRPHPLSSAFVRAGNQLGHALNPDFNGHRQHGFGLFQVNLLRGVRQSLAAAFLGGARPPGLTVECEAPVLRLGFTGLRCTHVSYLRQGRPECVRAEAEVVVSAGAVNSPQLLMLSGVGPAEALRAHGLAVIADRPGVGQNLQDHLVVPVNFHARGTRTYDGLDAPVHLARYLLTRSGPLASNLVEAGAFLSSDAHDGTFPPPDLELHFLPLQLHDHGRVRLPGQGFCILPTLLQPESRGAITLAAADPLQAPRIDPGYLRSRADLDVLVRGVKVARALASSEALRGFTAGEATPGTARRTKSELRAWVRGAAETVYHPVGTCRMGADAESVVDPELRVRGVEGLRVADASIMPSIVRGNTSAPCAMIGEKAAALLLGDLADGPRGGAPGVRQRRAPG